MFELLMLTWYRLLGLLRLAARPRLYLHESPTVLVSVNEATGEKRKTSLTDIIERCKSLHKHYATTAWLASGHAATIFCTLADFSYDKIRYKRTILRVPDGGQIAIDITNEHGENDNPKRPILIVCHGLTGGSHESYVINVLSKLVKPEDKGGLNWRGVVVNFRGCANSKVTTKQLYSGAWTDDLRSALTYISHRYPDAPLYGIGFSLGANVLGKYLGEEGEATPLKAGITLGCPWDFYAGHIILSSSWLRQIYSRAMASNLRRLLLRHRHVFENDERIDWDAAINNPYQTLYEFDSVVTRILAGYKSTEHYYRTASAKEYAANVAVPLLSVNAFDDPIVGGETVPTHLAQENPNLVFAITKHGGHLGWFEGFFRPRRWISKPVLEFLREVHQADPSPRRHLPTMPAVQAGKEPQVGDGMVLSTGKENIGFQLIEVDTTEVASAGVDKDGDQELIKGL